MFFIFTQRGMCCGSESLILCLEISCCFCFYSCHAYGPGGSARTGEGGGNSNATTGPQVLRENETIWRKNN